MSQGDQLRCPGFGGRKTRMKMTLEGIVIMPRRCLSKHRRSLYEGAEVIDSLSDFRVRAPDRVIGRGVTLIKGALLALRRPSST